VQGQRASEPLGDPLGPQNFSPDATTHHHHFPLNALSGEICKLETIVVLRGSVIDYRSLVIEVPLVPLLRLDRCGTSPLQRYQPVG
ncbi:MAG: hypothetical protein ACRDSO_20445, partial [Pseudonocardiaceae bacterium]